MGKRKDTTTANEKRKRLKQVQDSQLISGAFNHCDDSLDDNDNKDQHTDDDREMDYELRPRALAATDTAVEGLPIKRQDGRIERVTRQVVPSVEPEEDPFPDVPPKQQSDPELDAADTEDVDPALSPQEQLLKLKELVADLASRLMEDPEENYALLTRLRKMSESHNPLTSQIALMALLPVFKSLAPSYKIRLLTPAEKRELVSKQVASLRRYEQLLVSNYTHYVSLLAKLSKVSYSNSRNNARVTGSDVNLGLLATTAACEMCLLSLRHFNCRTDLFAIVVRRLNKRPQHPQDLKVFLKCVSVLEQLFQDDADNGDISHDIVTILAKSIKDKQYRVDELVLNVCLSMNLLQDYDPLQNRDPDSSRIKLKKKDRVHLSKKERKARKERKEIQEEMRVAEQAVTAEEREKYQANVLKTILRMYLEILKAGLVHGGNNKDAARLMAAVLEGLSRFGQMANFDLLGDFLLVLREIMTDIIQDHALAKDFSHSLQENEDDDEEDEDTGGQYTPGQLRTVLLCIATAFALVLNHGSNGKLPMTIDLSVFVGSLYAILADVCLDTDLEFSHKTLRLADPLAESTLVVKPSVNVSTTAELLLRCLDFVFFKSKNGTLPRASAFTKRLYMLVLHTPERTLLACLKFIGKLTARYDESLKGLWNTEERISDLGNYHLGIESVRPVDLERCNSGAATLWESVVLDRHYSPMIKDGLRSLLKNSKSLRE